MLELSPDDHYAHYALGRALEKQGKQAEANGHYKLASSLRPQNEHYASRILDLDHETRTDRGHLRVIGADSAQPRRALGAQFKRSARTQWVVGEHPTRVGPRARTSDGSQDSKTGRGASAGGPACAMMPARCGPFASAYPRHASGSMGESWQRSAPGLSCCSAWRGVSTDVDGNWLATKIAALRIFENEEGKFDPEPPRCQRPRARREPVHPHRRYTEGQSAEAFPTSAPPEEAGTAATTASARPSPARESMWPRGVFGARMAVELVNDGPVDDRPRLRSASKPEAAILQTPHFERFSKWACGPIFCDRERVLAPTHDKERQLTRGDRPEGRRRPAGTEVLAVELTSPERFTVFVDHVQGVDHALCERVTSVLRDYLGDYSVDVSSPGLERPLRKPAHFRDAVGRRVALRTDERKPRPRRGRRGRRARRHRRDQRRIRGHPV